MGECVAGQAKGQAVGLGDGVFDLLEAANRRDGAKRLVVDHIGIERHMRQDRGGKEVALRADAFTTGQHLGAFGAGILHDGLHGQQTALVGQWAHAGACDQAIADFQRVGVRSQQAGKFIGNLVVHQKAGGRNADLPRIAELGGACRLDGQGNVAIFGHDHRGVATELHGHALHVQPGHGGQLFAHRRGAGEGDLADQRVRDQVTGNVGRGAKHQTNHTCGHARIVKGPDQFGRRCGGFFRGLDDDRAAGSQGRRHLVHGLVDREIPGRERSDRAHRLFQHVLLHIDVARRHDAAINASALFGKPLDDVGRRHDLDLGFGQRLALL